LPPEQIADAADLLASAEKRLADGNRKGAAELCRHLLDQQPDHANAWHLLGLAEYRSGNLKFAATCIDRAIALQSDRPVYHYHCGNIYSEIGDRQAAENAYRNALREKPDFAEALNNLGLIQFDQDRLECAALLFQQAVRLQPRFTNAIYNLAMTLQALAMPMQALSLYDRVLGQMPDSAETRFNRAAVLLQIGMFEDGWREYECRFRHLPGENSRSGCQRWDGRSFHGQRLLVLDEQGIGDTLQFIRYLPLAKERGGTVIFKTVAPLAGLLKNFSGIDELCLYDDKTDRPTGADWFVPLMSLPGIFKTRLDRIPTGTPYIRPDPHKVACWEKRMTRGPFKVGLVWAGRPTAHYKDRASDDPVGIGLDLAGHPATRVADSRSRRLDFFTTLADMPGIQLYGLQKGPDAGQAEKLADKMDIINLGPDFADFADTAAAISALDLVISVDTSVAHLAGALAKPVWVLIPHAPDWRWMLEREDSPWYPSMRLFRQQRRGEWRPVFERIAEALSALLRHQAIK